MTTRTAALAGLLNKPLAWERAALEATYDALRAGLDTPGLQAASRRAAVTPNGDAGVLPLVGPITYRDSFFSQFFGGTSLVEFRRTLEDLLAQRSVQTILMLCDSPGGDVTGLEETAYELRRARQIKPIIAIVDCLAASACFWLAAQATEIIVTPSSQLGSVGVFTLHVDHSQELAQAGIRPTFIAAGRYKTEGNQLEPLADTALQHIQGEVDAVHDTFIKDIVRGRGRGLTADKVRKQFGEGRVVNAPEAMRRGMADRLFPTTSAAVSYAVNGYARDASVRADLDHIDRFFRVHGDPAERTAAAARMQAREPVSAAQRAADRDYAEFGVRIAERL